MNTGVDLNVQSPKENANTAVGTCNYIVLSTNFCKRSARLENISILSNIFSYVRL